MRIEVLDHGYVEFIEAWGTGRDGKEDWSKCSTRDGTPGLADYEVGIVEAARQSTQGSFRGWEQDAKLLKHLYANKHATPFEFSGMVLEVRAPIFVFREWHRHRTQSYNEASARYAPLPNWNYVPSLDRILLPPSSTNKQAGSVGGKVCSEGEAIEWLAELQNLYAHAEEVYQRGLNYGIPREIARLPMPVARYSQMRASTNLRNWLAFLTLRMDPAAQAEIRMYANAVGSIIADVFPQTWSLFNANVEHRPEATVPTPPAR